MANVTFVIEESRSNVRGHTDINWRCKGCGHIMRLPQQQQFSYCFHCGRKVINKVGGKQVIKE